MRDKLFSEMVTNVGYNVMDTSTTSQPMIKGYLNQAYFEILEEANFMAIDSDYSFATVSGTQDYVLPPNFNKEVYVRDATNLIELPWISINLLAQDFTTTLSTQGQVSRYTILEKRVISQPDSSTTLDIVSSSANDTTQTVRIKGVSGGVEVSEDVTLTGTTEVETSTSFSEIYSISKSATTEGTVTVTTSATGGYGTGAWGGFGWGDLAANTIAAIAPLMKDYRIMVIRLHEIPNSVITIECPYIKKSYPLTDDNDTPVIDCSDLMEANATSLMWKRKRQMTKAREWEKEYEKKLRKFIWSRENQLNQVKQINYQAYSRETV